MKFTLRLITFLAVLTLLLFSCSTIRSLPEPSEKVPELLQDSDLNSFVIQELERQSLNGELLIDFQLVDTNGIALKLGENALSMTSVEREIDGSWEAMPKESYELVQSTVVNCAPADYCIIIDQSGSMKKLQTTIFSEVDHFLGYKNNFDHVAIIKYASLAKISSSYRSNVSDIQRELHKKDTLIGGGTDTPLAYRLFLDSLIDVHPNKKLSVILFSDFSGIGGSLLPFFVRKAFNKNGNPRSTEEILSSLMENAFDKNVKTNRIIYSEKIKEKRFTKRGKRQFYELINSDFGKTYVINSLGSISSCLKEFMNVDCLTSRVRIPIDEIGSHKYRLTIANNSGVKQIVIEEQLNEVSDSLESNMIFSLDTINYLNIKFETGSDKLSESSYSELNKVYDFLHNYPNISIQLQGHTDNKGSYEYNLDLSSRRAEAAKKYLLNKGIASNRLSSVGFGFSRPLDSNDTPEGRQRNRRTEFIVVEK